MKTMPWLLLAVLLTAPRLAAEPAPDPTAANTPNAIGDEPAEPPTDAGPPPAEPPKPTPRPAKDEPPPDSGKPEPAKRKRAYIHVLEPNSVVRTKGPENSVVARGKLQMVIPDDEVILYCNAVDYSGEETGIATVTGDLKIVTGKMTKKNGLDVIENPENIVTGDIGYVFTKEKRAVIDGHVVVVHTPQKQAPEDANELEQARYDQSTLYCDRLTYWYSKGHRKGVAQARLPNTTIRVAQKTRRGTAGQATFHDFEEGETETGDVLDLLGGVYLEDDEGQLIEAEVCRIFLELEQTQWLNVKRLVVNLEENEETKPSGPPATPGGEPAPSPGETPPAPAPPAP